MAIALARDGGDDDRHTSSGGRHRWTSVMAIRRRGRWRWSNTVLVVVDDGSSPVERKSRWKERILSKAANSPVGRGQYLCPLRMTACYSFFSYSHRYTGIRAISIFSSFLLLDRENFATSNIFRSRRTIKFAIALKMIALRVENAGEIENFPWNGWKKIRSLPCKASTSRHSDDIYVPLNFESMRWSRPTIRSTVPITLYASSTHLATPCPLDTLFFHIRRNRCVAEFGSRLIVPSFSPANKDLDVRSTSIWRGTSYRMTLLISKPIDRANLL